jgi:cytochrome c oxidase subunit 4
MNEVPLNYPEENPIFAAETKRYHAFINLSLFLAFVTSVEIVLIFMPFAKWVLISVLVFLSVVKFFCVILWFMHLIYDKIMLFLIFLSGLMIATGTVTALLYLFTPEDMDKALYTTSLNYTECAQLNSDDKLLV